MIVVCEECGQKYNLDTAKIGDKGAKFKCRNCNHIIYVSKPAKSDSHKKPVPETRAKSELETPENVVPSSQTPRPGFFSMSLSGRRFDLRYKMILFFFLIPILMMITAGAIFHRQLDDLVELIAGQSFEMVSQFGEQMIAEKSKAVSQQIQIYLQNHPNLQREEFANNKDFRQIAIQRVGLTGYTALYEMPDENGVWKYWVHADPKLIGNDIQNLRVFMGTHFNSYWKIIQGVIGGTESKGYHTLSDSTGQRRYKYMVCTPIEGTQFVVSTTTYLDEFSILANKLKTQAEALANGTKLIIYGTLFVILVLIGIIVSIFGRKITGRIADLTDMADRFSVGDMEVRTGEQTNDEIGDLAVAITRMQNNLRLSIERLRRK